MQKYDDGFTKKLSFGAFLKALGLKIADELHGITTARWSAAKAGLGIIRRNNFLYTKYGSWVWIDTWMMDKELEYIETPDVPLCPENCTRCVDACPTCALSAPYSMNMGKCITCLTYNARGAAPENIRDKMGKWLYGCDGCQNACPMNKNKWEEAEDYPGLSELADYITLEKILQMDEKTFTEVICLKFWYIKPDSIWIWKCNALRAMANDYNEKYESYFKDACSDSNENVGKMALWACEKLGL